LYLGDHVDVLTVLYFPSEEVLRSEVYQNILLDIKSQLHAEGKKTLMAVKTKYCLN
jgi:hypothetical protein